MTGKVGKGEGRRIRRKYGQRLRDKGGGKRKWEGRVEGIERQHRMEGRGRESEKKGRWESVPQKGER